MIRNLILLLLTTASQAFCISNYKKSNYQTRLMPVMLNIESHHCLHLPSNIGTNLVKVLSNTLPQFDSISHIVLTTNSNIISSVLENDNLPILLKKDIILLTIKMTQEGDNMGGQILELYYYLVDKLL